MRLRSIIRYSRSRYDPQATVLPRVRAKEQEQVLDVGRDTDFDFGANVGNDRADNLRPWGRGTEADGSNATGPASGCEHQADSASVSENWLVEQTCEVVLKQVRLLTQTVRKGNRTPMSIQLDKYYNEKKAHSGNGFKRNPFLKSEDIPAKGLPFTVISLREANGGFSDLLMDVAAGKKEYTVGLKRDSVLLGQLCQQFGMKDTRWPKQKGVFVLAKGKYINLQPAK